MIEALQMSASAASQGLADTFARESDLEGDG